MYRTAGFSILILIVITCVTCTAEQTQKPSFESIPKIDVHAHFFVDMPGLADMLRSINMNVINICTRGNDQEAAEELFQKYGTMFRFASTFDVTRRYEKRWVSDVKEWLNNSYENGAIMTKIWKKIGMEFKTPKGEWLMPDDPLFDPVYEFLTERDVPLLAHLAEPLAAWLPLNPEKPHYSYYSTHPEWHFYNREGVPQHAGIIAARDIILQKHPNLIFIGAHMGSQSHDVSEIAERLEKYDNYYVECSARVPDLTHQPKGKVREFFIKYQDRIMYGTDIVVRPKDPPHSNEELSSVVRNSEEKYRLDWQYFSGAGTMNFKGREIESLDLPIVILKKFYHDNAARVILKSGS